ncbi:MAG: hypothetical protein KDC88_12425 [Ignavibacteriae bacterium]|nr:hypothetical protein [Ignavibacteriota bacterium]
MKHHKYSNTNYSSNEIALTGIKLNKKSISTKVKSVDKDQIKIYLGLGYFALIAIITFTLLY